jgi:hypothetical protein
MIFFNRKESQFVKYLMKEGGNVVNVQYMNYCFLYFFRSLYLKQEENNVFLDGFVPKMTDNVAVLGFSKLLGTGKESGGLMVSTGNILYILYIIY